MTIRDILVTGVRAKLPPVTVEDLRMRNQWEPGTVGPCPEIIVGELVLPFPPSMNSYWQLRAIPGGGRIIVVAKKGRQYQKLVASLVALRWRRPMLTEPIGVRVDAWAPSSQYAPGARYEWDVDNRLKPLLDALAKAGVMRNDKQVRDLQIVDQGISPPGRVLVTIRRLGGMEYGTEAKGT